MDQSSNPGSATPETLHRIYKDRAAVTANPFLLRDVQASHGVSFQSTIGCGASAHAPTSLLGGFSTSTESDPSEREALLQSRAILAPIASHVSHGCNCGTCGCGSSSSTAASNGSTRRIAAQAIPQHRPIPSSASSNRRGDSPPRARFKVLSEGQRQRAPVVGRMQVSPSQTGMQLTLNSLDMTRKN